MDIHYSSQQRFWFLAVQRHILPKNWWSGQVAGSRNTSASLVLVEMISHISLLTAFNLEFWIIRNWDNIR